MRDHIERLADDAGGALADARAAASVARSALFAHPMLARDADDAATEAWHGKLASLRTAAATAEQELSVAESEAVDANQRVADLAPHGGRLGNLAFVSHLAGAPPEVREYRELLRKASLGRVVSAAMRGERLSSGVEVEIRQAGSLPDDCIPYEMLDVGIVAPAGSAGALQHRVDATSGGLASVPTYQHTIIQRVFSMATAQTVLGCRMLMAPTGDALIPVIAQDGGQTPTFQAKAGRVDAVAGTINAFVRQPKRLSAGWRFSLEDEARVMGFEAALRMDLNRSMSNALDLQLLGEGDSQVRGFLATAANGGIAALTAATTTVDYAAALTEFARGVDGIFASSLEECTLLVRNEVYTKLATLLNTGSGQTAIQHGRQMLGMLRASANLPAPASNVSTGILARRGAMDANSFVPVWTSRGVKLVRDELTRAPEGEVRLTATAFFNHVLARPAAYVRTSWKTA